jgi:8-oxo-dGTP pyrophosphatase MutT (NUDIX family)
LPVAQDKPLAAAVVVWREHAGVREYLLLHRHHRGADYEGDWAWTSPAGTRQPGEDPRAAAERELFEETGLRLEIAGPLDHVTDDVALFVAQAPFGAEVVIDPEHDRYEWVGRDEAIARCLPKIVGDGIRLADDTLPGDG